MFYSKKCKRCGRKLKDDWLFCPYCGEEITKRESYMDLFEEFERDIEREFERLDKMFGMLGFPRINIKAPIRTGGISITIRSGTGMKPQIEVKTTGEYKKFEPEIKRRLGIKEGVQEVETEKIEEKKVKVPKITEEPETKIERKGNVETITIKLPDVKNPEDINVRKLEQSIEVKAFVGDKAYFKLIPVKPNSRIISQKFENGILRIELVE